MSILLSIPRTASAFGINPPFQATHTGPVTDGFLLYRGRPGRGHHYSHRWDQEHEGEQDSPTGGRLHQQTPISWTTHAAPKVPHLAQRTMRPTIEVRPNNLNTQEYMKKDQIEQRIDEWTKKHAKGNEQRVLKNFLMMDFAVQPNPKMQPCSNCEQQFMLFMLLPMKQHNMNTYDPDEHRLFCYNCCTEVGQMLHPGRYVPPDQQATERQKALNQNPLA